MVDDGIDHRLGTRSLDETLAGLGQCSRFNELIREASLDYILRRSGLHTLVAPTNEAIAQVSVSGDDVERFLNQHMFQGGFESFDLRRCQRLKNQNGDVLPVRVEDGSVRIANAELVRTDIACTNGVIHIAGAVISA